MFHFRPSIVRPDSTYELPRPIVSLRVLDAFDFAQWKVPLVAGDLVIGHTPSGVDISIEGQIASQAGQFRLSEEQMFVTLEELRTAVRSASPDETYRFFMYFDPVTSTYRSFRGCTTVRFEYDLTQKWLFTYSLVIHASLPQMESTPP